MSKPKVKIKETCSRPDRKQKLLNRKNEQETVIKCCLNKFLGKSGNNKISLLNEINKRINAYSKRQFLMSISLNLFLKELLNTKNIENIVDIEIPDIFETTFIRQFILGTDSAQIPNPYITQFYNKHPILKNKLDSLPRYNGDRNIYSSGAIKFCTNLKNHYTTNIQKWIKKWIYSDIVKKEIKDKKLDNKILLYEINNWTKETDKEKTKDMISKLSDNLKNDINLQKKILGDGSINEEWLKSKDNLLRIVKYSFFINNFLTKKQFSISPICGIRNHFMTIDTHSLYGIMKDAKIIECCSKDFIGVGNDHWYSIASIDKIKGKDKIFTGTIETDGISVCVHFKGPKKEKINIKDSLEKLKKLTKKKDVEVWGCDPGRTNIMTMVRKNEDNTYKKLILTRKQYYSESGIFKARVQTQKWQRKPKIKSIIEELSLASNKGIDVSKCLAYINIIIKSWDELWNEYTQKKWMKQKLRLYGGKKRVLALFFNKMKTEGKKTIVGFGSAKFAPGGKGELSIPTCSSYKECCNRFLTAPIDEFRTSRIYYKDGKTILQIVKRRDNNKEVRGLLWCSSTINKENKFINRDLNAAINILNCFILPTRPEIMCRVEGKPKLEKIIGRKIKC